MPSIETYDTESRIRLLLQGPTGAGKTTLACQFPGAWVIDCDISLGGALRWLKKNNKALPLGYDIIDRDEEGKSVPENMRYARLVGCLQKVYSSASVETVVLDGMTKIGDYIKAHVLRLNPTKSGGFEQTSWGFYYSTWVQLIGQVTAQRKHLVLIAHEKIDKNEMDGSTQFFLNVQGQFKDMAGSMFTEVWRAEVVLVGQPPAHKWQLRTIQDYRCPGLKSGLGLPPVFEFDWRLIEEKLKEGTK